MATKKSTKKAAPAKKATKAVKKAVKPAKAAPPAPTPAPPVQKAPRKPENDTTYSWHGLQEALRAADTVEKVEAILKHEIKGEARLRWMLRIQGRLHALRSEAEIAELTALARA